MSRLLLAATLTALLMGCATALTRGLSERMPAELPDAAVLAGWEKLAGQAELGDASVVYELYVNPLHPALYEITRYRLTTSFTSPDGRVRREDQTEKLVWNPTPGTGAPLHCFERIVRRTWRTLWMATVREWRRVEPGSPAYKTAMSNAIRVYVASNPGAMR